MTLPQNDIWHQVYSGQWYQTHHPVLMQARAVAKTLCCKLNQLSSADQIARNTLLKQLLPHVQTIELGNDFACDYGINIYASGSLFLGNQVVLLDAAAIRFGKDVSVGDGVVFASLTHPLEAARRKAGWQQARPIEIGDNVTIGEGSTILPGVVIAANQQLAPGSVVTR
ncbi:maltose acetyltransferase domain-containing protein [Alteromonas lipolytica]|uniref:Acetyltransferase n=1 Tax=Alteromonas lipolytica TaxID=1856405 RepID=A0A1E8FK76_9ALTE|nr:maltose acetyltransferase domain-containing protein [Alteromonas lipolytica]OFI36018.1 hypothetical protein BFC17_10090 [Alteromonas lipolytica]GGF71642.1 acetyltransferase [Alteromonas lipolytica]